MRAACTGSSSPGAASNALPLPLPLPAAWPASNSFASLNLVTAPAVSPAALRAIASFFSAATFGTMPTWAEGAADDTGFSSSSSSSSSSSVASPTVAAIAAAAAARAACTGSSPPGAASTATPGTALTAAPGAATSERGVCPLASLLTSSAFASFSLLSASASSPPFFSCSASILSCRI